MKNIPFDIVDFHAHVLPSADHGSDSVNMSLSQLRLLHECGVGTVVATPHFYPEKDTVESFLDRRQKSEKLLCESINSFCFDEELPLILSGAEVLVCAGMQHMKNLESLCVEGTNTVLLEMPDTDWSDELVFTVSELCSGKLTPVLAHPHRYNEENVEKLYEITKIPFQINACDSLHFSGKKLARKWLIEGKVIAVGSDLHGVDKHRAAALLSFCEKNGEIVFAKSKELLEGARHISV